MTSQTGYDYWFLWLPAGEKERGKSTEERITDELTELAERGWEPVTVAGDGLRVRFLMRKLTA